MTSFIDALYEPERRCRCDHHEGSHCHGFSNQACMWCDCRAFEDAEAPVVATSSTPSARRHALPLR